MKTPPKMSAYQKVRIASLSSQPVEENKTIPVVAMKSIKHSQKSASQPDPKPKKPLVTYSRLIIAQPLIQDSDSDPGDEIESVDHQNQHKAKLALLVSESHEQPREVDLDDELTKPIRKGRKENTRVENSKDSDVDESDSCSDNESDSDDKPEIEGGGRTRQGPIVALSEVPGSKSNHKNTKQAATDTENGCDEIADSSSGRSSYDVYSSDLRSENDGDPSGPPTEGYSSSDSQNEDLESDSDSVAKGIAESSLQSDVEMNEDSGSSSIEETITTWGARSALAEFDRRVSLTYANDNSDDMIEDDGMVADDETSSESGNNSDSVDGFPRGVLLRTPSPDPSESSQSTSTLVATHARAEASVTELVPPWFPENIKNIYKIDHRGGALTFKELDTVTCYRASLEITRRRKWKRYIEAGNARWKLQQILHKLRVRPTTKKFYAFRKEQYTHWKGEALQRWKKLEKYHRGVLLLDEMINTNFLMERVIYKEKLDRHRPQKN